MELKHSLNLLASRYSLAFKLLIFFIIVTAIAVAIMVSIMTPAMDPLFLAIEESNVVNEALQTGMSMFLRNFDYAEGMEKLSELYGTFIGIIEQYRNELLVFYILTWVVFFFYRLVVSMTSIPIADSVNVYMNTSVHKSLMGSFAENLWVSLKYAICATFINSLINTGIGIMVYQIIMSTVVKWGIASFTVALLLMLLLLSIKYTLLLGWIPIIVNEKKKVLVALVDSIKQIKYWFKYGFLSSFILYLFIIAGLVLLGLTTFFIMVPIIIVSEMVLLRNIELVCYYNVKQKRYYIDRNTIIKPREELY